MFLPRVALASKASSLAPAGARRWTLKRDLLLGSRADLVSRPLLTLSSLLTSATSPVCGILLLATSALRLSFRATARAKHLCRGSVSARAKSVMLVLNALLGQAQLLHQCLWPYAWGCAPGGRWQC